MRCPRCDTEVAASRLSCPSCHQLIHSGRLKELAEAAQSAEADDAFDVARERWQEALQLLPPDSRQYAAVVDRVEGLSERRVAGAPPASVEGGATIPWKKIGAGAGALSLLVWKFKAVFAVILTKGKLLLLGLAKWPMLFGAFASFGVFWAEWGWRFALGLIVSIYVHELGHVAALKRYGIPASAPMFIPGLGAYVRLKRPPSNPSEDAAIGLEGPLWGLAAAALAYAVFLVTGWGTWGAVARFGAWINIFNLIPVWQLDGARGFAGLDRLQRAIVLAVMLATWAATKEGLLILVALIGAYRVVVFDGPERGDWSALVKFAVALVCLGYLSVIEVPLG